MNKLEKRNFIFIFFCGICWLFWNISTNFLIEKWISKEYSFLISVSIIIIFAIIFWKILNSWKNKTEKIWYLDEFWKKHNHKAWYMALNVVFFINLFLLILENYFYKISDFVTFSDFLWILFISLALLFSIFNYYYYKNPDKI